MFESAVYFYGPKTSWANHPHEEEIIARFSSRFRFLAALFARSLHERLDPMRCGYAVMRAGAVIESVTPKV
jgi:hypothetical protein